MAKIVNNKVTGFTPRKARHCYIFHIFDPHRANEFITGSPEYKYMNNRYFINP